MEMAPSHDDINSQPNFSRHKEDDSAAAADATQETTKSRERTQAADECNHHDDSTSGNMPETHLTHSKRRRFSNAPDLPPSPKRLQLKENTPYLPCNPLNPNPKIALSSKTLNDASPETLEIPRQSYNRNDSFLEEPTRSRLASSESSSNNFGQYYREIHAHDKSTIIAGNVCYSVQLNEYKRPDEIVAFGLCLGQAPRIDPNNFIGRTAELDVMSQILQPGYQSTEQRYLVLGGMGGIGKTQIAIAYAQRHQHCYKSAFWLNATSKQTLQVTFRLVARRFLTAQDAERLNDEQNLARVHEWLSDTRNTQWLLIFDNYDDPDQFDIGEYCPYAAHGSVIITSRLPDRVRGQQVRVQPLSDTEESLEILRTRSRRDNVKNDPYAHRLAERLGGLPLALATVGAYLRHSTFTFQQYLLEYEKHWNIDPRRPLQLQEYRNRTLYTTWDISYTRLQSDHANAAQMLKLLAYFDNQKIWYELLHAGITDDLPMWLHNTITDPVNFESVLKTLVDYCFVEVQTAMQCYSMHQCIHDWAYAGLNSVIDTRYYWYAFDCVAANINKDDWGSFGLLRYAHVNQTRLSKAEKFQPRAAIIY